MSRAALLLALALAALPASASAAVPAALGPDGRVYPLLGGGARAPRDGLPATQLRVGLLLGAAALADGSVAALPFREEPFAVAPDGRVATLPDPPGEPEEISALAGASDGALLALRRGGVLRLRPGAAAWAELPRPAAIPASFVPDTLPPLPAGYALVGRRTTWRAEGGTVTRESHPPDVLAATAAPDGTIVLAFGGSDRLLALPPGAPRASCAPRPAGTSGSGSCRCPRAISSGSAPAPSPWTSSPAARPWRRPSGPSTGSARGDGGPFEAQGGLPVAIAPDGAALLPGGADNPVRLAVPPGTTRTLAAVAPATYAALRRGAVTISSTFAGAAGIEVRSGGVVVTSAIAAVGPGRRPCRCRTPRRPGPTPSPCASSPRTAARPGTACASSPCAGSRASRRCARRAGTSGARAYAASRSTSGAASAGDAALLLQALAVERRRGPTGAAAPASGSRGCGPTASTAACVKLRGPAASAGRSDEGGPARAGDPRRPPGRGAGR